MNNTICVTPIATTTNEVLPTVSQSNDHNRCERRQGYARTLAALLLPGLLAFCTGATLATTEALDLPAAVTAALLKEVI